MILRTFALLLALSLGVAHADGAKEAQELLEAVETKLNGAKTLKIGFKTLMGPEGQQIEFNGEVAIAEAGKLKFMLKGVGPDGSPLSMSMTSNGTTLRTVSEEGGASNSRDSEMPAEMAPVIRSSLSRFSVVGPIFLAGPASGPTDAEPFPSTNFSLGAKETVGEKVLQVIEFDTSTMGQAFHVKLWIDTVTHLPAKRVIDRGQQMAAITETFSSIELDPALPADLFKLNRDGSEGAAPEPATPTSKPTSKPAK